MIYEGQLFNLISSWNQRAQNSTNNQSYKDGVSECAYELSSMISRIIEDEYFATAPPEEVEQYLLEQEADAYLASIEAHELS